MGSSVQLPFIYLNLSAILVPSVRFSCRSYVWYHTFYCFITRTRATRLAKRKLPSRFRQVLSIVSRRTRCPISMTLVPTPIKPGSDTSSCPVLGLFSPLVFLYTLHSLHNNYLSLALSSSSAPGFRQLV